MFGVEPTRAATEYGYIRPGALRRDRGALNQARSTHDRPGSAQQLCR
jgi:mannose-1-phosphate guanylyltransferase